MAKSPQRPTGQLGCRSAQSIDAQIRRHARRGLLELDILIDRFLQAEYPTLSIADKQNLLLMLQMPDIALWNAVAGVGKAATADIHLLAALRRCGCPRQ